MRTRILALLSLTGAAVVFTAASAASPVSVGHRAGTIAFMRLMPGPTYGARLFVVRPDGSHLQPVTPPNTTVESYAWSPNGKWIAYVDQRASLWLIRPDGAGRRLLLPASKLSVLGMSWSPNGRKIAIVSPGPDANGPAQQCGGKLYLVPIAHGQPASASLHKVTSCHVAWSPRGDEITYDYGGIWVIHPDGTGRRLVTRLGRGGEWSPDGTQLAFGGGAPGSHLMGWDQGFAVVHADGHHLHVVTTRAYTEYPVAWAPRGREILYGRAEWHGNKPISQGIYVIDSKGRNDRQVTPDSPPQTAWGALAWSPDGRSIVYATDQTGSAGLDVIGANGQDKVQLTNTPPDTEVDPSWVR